MSGEKPVGRRSLVGRREFIVGGAAVLIAGCTSGGGSDTSGSTATSRPARRATPRSTPTTLPAGACLLSPEVTAGPYYIERPLARADITEGRPGTPFRFRVRVLDAKACAPLAGAAVDVWHCDAGGEYSGWNGNSLEETGREGRNAERYLRGVQLTGDDGIAEFTTIFPGWYEGRTVHIHLKVHEGGTIGRTYDGGHVAHVGQAFFDEDVTAEILRAGPYAKFGHPRTKNDQDSLYAKAGPGALTEMTARGRGYSGLFTCAVDPEASPPPGPMF